MSGPALGKAKALRHFIAAFFETWDQRIKFLSTLNEQGHEYEALLLCLVYIEGFANWLRHPNKTATLNFTETLMKYGGNEGVHAV